jgi:hypothetical protein
LLTASRISGQGLLMSNPARHTKPEVRGQNLDEK